GGVGRAQREANPGALAERRLERVDRLLDQRALREVALAGLVFEDFRGEVVDQVGVEEELPRLGGRAAGREEPVRDLLLGELDRVLLRGLDRLADAELV